MIEVVLVGRISLLRAFHCRELLAVRALDTNGRLIRIGARLFGFGGFLILFVPNSCSRADMANGQNLNDGSLQVVVNNRQGIVQIRRPQL